jgi:hypothetical protein
MLEKEQVALAIMGITPRAGKVIHIATYHV